MPPSFVVRKLLESHFSLTQAHVFVSKSCAHKNGPLWNPFSRFLLFNGSIFFKCLSLVASSFFMDKTQ